MNPFEDLSVRLLCVVSLALAIVVLPRPAAAQQRPLVTEDPEPIGAGRVLIEGGIDYAHNQEYPVSGLKGDLWRVPTIGISVGLSSIAELQIDGAFYDRLHIDERRTTAPLFSLVTARGVSAVGSTFEPQRPDAVVLGIPEIEHAVMDTDAMRPRQGALKRIALRPVASGAGSHHGRNRAVGQ